MLHGEEYLMVYEFGRVRAEVVWLGMFVEQRKKTA
jgi:hypothetical protein